MGLVTAKEVAKAIKADKRISLLNGNHFYNQVQF